MKYKNKITNLIFLGGIAALTFILSGCNSESPVTTDVTPEESVQTYKPAGWYGKTQVTLNANGTIYSHTTAGVFGALKQSEEGKDQNDIKGYGPATFQVVFPQTEWGEDNGDYFSNYKSFTEDLSEKQVWTFQLKAAGSSNFPITITLDGLYDVTYLEDDERVLYKDKKSNDTSRLDALHLVDVDNGKSYTYAQLKTLDLYMDNLSTRTFRWVLGEPDASDYEPVVSKVTSVVQSKAIEAQTPSQPTSKFGLPPQ